MKRNIFVKSVVASVLSFASVAFAEKLTVNEVRQMCTQYSPDVAQNPESEINQWLKGNSKFDCTTVAKLDEKNKKTLKMH
jgi:hypothetical protein